MESEKKVQGCGTVISYFGRTTRVSDKPLITIWTSTDKGGNVSLAPQQGCPYLSKDGYCNATSGRNKAKCNPKVGEVSYLKTT